MNQHIDGNPPSNEGKLSFIENFSSATRDSSAIEKLIFSLIISIITVAIQIFTYPYIGRETSFFLPFIGVVISVLYGGFWMGIFSICVSVLISSYFFLYPNPSYKNLIGSAYILVFIFEGLLVSIIHAFYARRTLRLAASEKRKAQFLKQMPDAIIFYEKSGNILEVNPSSEHFFGKPLDLINESDIRELVSFEEQFDLTQPLKDKKELAKFGVIGKVKKSDMEFPVLVRVVETAVNGNSVRIAYIQDISLEKEREEKLLRKFANEHTARLKAEEEVKAREEFLSIASHELKTPLTSMVLQLQTILHSIRHVSLAEFSVDKMMKMLESTEQQSKRLSRMINDLLNVSLITTGRLDLEFEKVDITQLTKDVVTRFKEQADRVGSKIKLSASSSLEGMFDRVRIEQVITNLLSNSLKYGKGKDIEVNVEKIDEQAKLTVSDSGIGIPEENIQRIFDRFERSVSNNEYKGLGVGLYIVNQIVKAHKGKIKVESELGKGSTFTVFLPITQ